MTSSVIAVLLVGLAMPVIIVDVQVEARRHRRMTQIVAHEPQIDLVVGHMRPGTMTQPVRRSLFKQVGARRRGVSTFAQPLGGAVKHVLDDRVQRGARQRPVGRTRALLLPRGRAACPHRVTAGPSSPGAGGTA